MRFFLTQKFIVPAFHPPQKLRKIACLIAAAFEADVNASSSKQLSILDQILTNAAELWSSESYFHMVHFAI